MLMMFLLGILPLIIFAIIDYYSSLKNGVCSAIGMAALTGFLTIYFLNDIWQEVALILVSMIIMGILSIRTKKEIYFKLQPVVVNAGIILTILWFQIFDEPLIMKFLPKLKELLPPEQLVVFNNPDVIAFLARSGYYIATMTFIHAFIVGYAAFKLSNSKWVLSKALGMPLLFMGIFLMEMMFKLITV